MIAEQWQRARRILAVRLDNLGDVLLTTPAIHAIKASLPAAEITLLASPVGAQAGRLNPDLANVMVYQAPWVDPWQQLPHDSHRERTAIAALRACRFDAAVIFTSFRQSPLPAAYLCYLAGIPLRLAATDDACGSLLTTRHRPPARLMHEVERGLDLVSAVGFTTSEPDLVLSVPPLSARRITRWLTAQHALPSASAPLVVVHPGCSMPARTYPPERYATVITLLVRRLGARVIVTGSGAERDLVARVVADLPMDVRLSVRTSAGELKFDEFCALIQAGDVVITNNTGPMHIAAAVKTPVVALFALTNPPEQWGPWRVPHRLLYHEVPCRLCYSRICPHGQECLRLVSAEQIVAAVAELLAERAGGVARTAPNAPAVLAAATSLAEVS